MKRSGIISSSLILVLAVIAIATMTLAKRSFAQRAVDEATVQILTEDGGHLDYCRDSHEIVFDRMGADGYFDVWVMDADGQNQKPLTIGRPGLPQRHVGMPEWYPDCEHIVVQVERADAPDRIDRVAVPGSGILNELWIIQKSTNKSWKLHGVADRTFRNVEGVLHPHFSHNGRKLIWAERVGGGGGVFGEWVMKMADFQIKDGVPSISRIQTIVPGSGKQFYETHSFRLDDSAFLFSSTMAKGLEIFTMDLASKKTVQLTFDPATWDEHAHFSPDGKQILWISSEGLIFRPKPFELETEFWTMDADGSRKKQITFFHRKGHRHFMNKDFAVAADSAWENQNSFIGLVITGRPESKDRGRGAIVRVTLP